MNSILLLHGMAGLGEVILIGLAFLAIIWLVGFIFGILHIAQASGGKVNTAIKVLSILGAMFNALIGSLFLLNAYGDPTMMLITAAFLLPLVLMIIAFVIESNKKTY